MDRRCARALANTLREDFTTHGRRPLSAGFHAVAVHRLARALHESALGGGPLLRTAVRLARVAVVNLYGVELPPDADLGRRLHLPHAQGVVVVPGSVVGDDVMLRHGVTLGLGSAERGGRPRLGNRVQVGPGASILGAVVVGDDVLVGPHALVVQDLPAGSRAVAPLARVLPPRSQVDLTGVREDHVPGNR